VGFVLFFLAEYSNIILISVITIILFLGGWLPFFNVIPFSLVPQTINSAIKTMFIITLFILVRGVLPRYRYDQLMRLGWKVFLPLGLAFFVVFASVLLSFNVAIELLA
jgi:NADH-quinone oxidoreductase subunit H